MPSLLLASNFSQSSLTLSELSDRVLGDLGLRNNTVVTSGDIMNWANEAQTKLAKAAKCFHVTTVSGVTSGTAEYPLPSESTARCIAVQEVLYNGQQLRYLTTDQLRAQNIDWRSTSPATPWAYYVRDFSCIGLYPAPDTTDVDALTVVETVIPPNVSAPQEFFAIPHGADDALIAYCCLKASMKDAYGEGKDRIAIYKRDWDEGLLAVTQLAKTVTERDVVRMGGNALMYDNPFDYWFRDNDTATAL